MNSLLQDRTYLHNRHRLSHQQIDRWLRENRAKEFLPEKLKQMEAVKNFLFVTGLLAKNDIVFTCFKGPLLSFRIYNDPTIRISHDIDLLIEKEMICKTVDVLTKNDFQMSEEMFWPQKKIQQDLFIKAIHHLSFHSQKLNICVEIHWVLMHELPVSPQKVQRIISENKTNIQFSGLTFAVFSPEFEFVYLLIHGARHGWNRLKWLVDIHDYPVAGLNLQKLEELTNELHVWRIIGQVDILLTHFFNKRIPITKKERVPYFFIRYAYDFIEDDNSQRLLTREMLKHSRYLWLLFPGIYYKYHFVSQYLFRLGDLNEINSSYKITYYLYRPFSFIRRRILNV